MRCLLAAALCMGCATPARSAPDSDPYVEHTVALRKQLSGKKLGKLQYRTEKPFVVVGDGSADELEHDALTVQWAVAMLEKDFFTTRPTKILDVYLFRNAKSYERGVKRLTGESPSTPYGFYSSTHEGLFMNIATGGGTLVHEIVHPYVESDFPNAPPWLNEGLGSLFEQSAERGGHIIGLTNWRLAGLQSAIDEDTVPSFEKLTHYSTAEFYGDDSGVNYAASRYLLYYLQEQGVLRNFYKTCRDARDKDPSCIGALKKVLGTDDLVAFKKKWQLYVAQLTFP
ncbi:MAG TPA: hypothetical protein VMZ53_22205 [Kofleriaceae bacterium]|nr:hypothetical protein [Kofleriaceae bacterium]